VLSTTKLLVSSVLSSSQLGEVDRVRVVAGNEPLGDDVAGDLQLRAGILRFSTDRNVISDPKLNSLDDAALAGLSTSALKRLSITSGSLVNKFYFRGFVWLPRKRRKRKNRKIEFFNFFTYRSRRKL
jgi:peroxin-6